MKIYDITVPITPDLAVYPGDPPVRIERTMDLERGDIARVSQLNCSTHSGTHVDPPSHFIKDGVTLDQLPLDVLIGCARVVDVGQAQAIDARLLERCDLNDVTRVLFKTRNSQLWQTPHEFHRAFVYLETDAAELLVQRGVQLVGIDYLSVEKFDFTAPTTHWALLRHNVIIVEGLDLRAVAPGDYELICLPLKIKDGDGGPARVVLRELR